MALTLGCFSYPPQTFPFQRQKSYFHGNSLKNFTTIRASSSSSVESLEEDGNNGVPAKGSGTSARGRRLLKLREEKHRREQQRLNTYPSWAKVLEDACKNDVELRAVFGDSIGNPELMRKRVEERVRKKGRDIKKSKTGSVLAFKVSFRDFNPLDSYSWVELFGSPSDRDVDLFGSVIQAWYVMGRLGAFNSSNLQKSLLRALQTSSPHLQSCTTSSS